MTTRMPDPMHDQYEEDAMENAFYGLPDPKVRVKMTPEKLAILLHNCKEGTPEYILIEHELNIRIASIQSRATYVGAVAGISGIVLGVFLTAMIQNPLIIKCRCVQQSDKNIQKPISPQKTSIQAPVTEKNTLRQP